MGGLLHLLPERGILLAGQLEFPDLPLLQLLEGIGQRQGKDGFSMLQQQLL